LSEPGLTTMHLFGVPGRRVGRAVMHMGLDRRHLHRIEGLTFWKLLGTGDGHTFKLRDADLRRWGLLAVWASDDDLHRFERSSPVARGWRRLAEERWRADLRPLRSRGTWAGRQPFGPAGGLPGQAGPVAAITRARVRLGRGRAFRQAVPPVAFDADRAPGLRLSVAIGEAPVGLLGTFSVWQDQSALEAFAYRGDAHRQVVRRTPSERWYAEELFARFELLGAEGTVGGIDPLAS
jgi:hypothetical protein